jgi:hypothetical protein
MKKNWKCELQFGAYKFLTGVLSDFTSLITADLQLFSAAEEINARYKLFFLDFLIN